MTETIQKPLRKGEQTRAAILEAALSIASREGLEGLTIGVLADRMGMSKSGVFAHFGSREDLQCEVLRLYHQHFEQEVFYPSLREPRGLPRLESLFARWVARVSMEIASGCIYISGAVEYDDRPGVIREQLVEMVRLWQLALQRAATQSIQEGHLPPDTDADQLVFEMYGLVLALHHDARFIKRPGSIERAHAGFARLINNQHHGLSTSSSKEPAKKHPKQNTKPLV